MPYYRFDLRVGDTTVELIDGKTSFGDRMCADFAQVKRLARDLAKQTAINHPQLIGEGCAVAVDSTDDEEVFRVSIDDSFRFSSH